MIRLYFRPPLYFATAFIFYSLPYQNMKSRFTIILFFAYLGLVYDVSFAQSNQDSVIIRNIYSQALQNPKGHEWLEFLCKKIGGRLAGSPQAAAAVEFTKQIMDTLGLDRVYLQEVTVPHWVRGQREIGRVVNSKKMGTVEMRVCAIGNAVGTGEAGVLAEVIEIKDLKEIAKLGKAKIQGKIVFFNRPFDPTEVQTFKGYGKAGDQRRAGTSEAAKYGAIGVIIRSLTPNIDEFPHTGSLRYELNVPQIPAIAIATKDAELLGRLLKDDSQLKFYFETHCKMLKDKISYNVIGEIKGSEKPEEIIAVGGHLDSWDLAEGAHDDGAGCVQSIEVLRIFKSLNIKPKRTIRAVMFMNEENGLRGGVKYAEQALQNKELHIAAMESDAGGFTPRAIGIADESPKLALCKRWQPLFAPYDVMITGGGGGADISPLRAQGVTTMSLNPDSQRYFDFHHTTQDVFEMVNQRELQLGAAAMAGFIYLLAEYGL
jgi:carboxypeptidase Q